MREKIKKEESWWGDLSKLRIETKRNELINQILSDFIEKSDKLDFNWMDEWKNSCIHMNKKIKINNGDTFEKEAIFLGVDKNGNAIVKTDQGKELISSGEISIKGIY
jgi:biotin-(acetyl-CoA carboxylase) ligase